MAPPVISWFISPSNYSYKYHFYHSYWSYVHQLSYRLGGPLILGSELLPSGKLSHNYGKSQFLIGKSTISMAIFNSYFDITRATLGPSSLSLSCRSSTTASTYVANASLARKAFGVPWTTLAMETPGYPLVMSK